MGTTTTDTTACVHCSREIPEWAQTDKPQSCPTCTACVAGQCDCAEFDQDGCAGSDVAAFIAHNGVTRCEVGASGKSEGSKRDPFNGNRAGQRRRKSDTRPVSPAFDTTDPTWKAQALALPTVQDSIKSGVFAALVGSGWQTDGETVADMISMVNVKLIERYLDKWAGYNGTKTKNTIDGFCRFVAYQKVVSYIKLHIHMYDGAVDAVRIDATDATAEDKAPRVVVDDASALAYLRVDQRQRLTAAVDALDTSERSHFAALMAGRTSAEWASGAGLSAVQATRQKTTLLAKLARIVQE